MANTLTRAARELEASPSDVAAWLMAASQLATEDRLDDAAHAFRQLGDAACRTGQVALAIGCAHWLRERGLDDGALVDQIAKTHGAGSKKVDAETRAAPPAPRGQDKKTGDQPAVSGLDEAAALVLAAVDTAHAAWLAHAPEKVPATPLVNVLAPAELRALIDVIALRAVPRGSVVVDVGQAADALYWIAAGAVAVSREGQRLGDLRAGAFFGEIALVGGTTRTARVTTTEDTLLLEIPAAAVERLASKQPAVARVLAQHARNRLLANVMRTSPLFTLLPDAERAELLGRFETALLQDGERFVRRGDRNDHLWILVSGACEVRDGDTVIATLGAGDGVGEMSLLGDGQAGLDVTAIGPTVVLRLSRQQFREVADRFPEVLGELQRLAEQRAEANAALVHDANDLIV